jgi:hypothetical protein
MIGPERYYLTYSEKAFSVKCTQGSSSFSGIAASKLPKLYVVSIDEKPVYVGQTTRFIRHRLWGGWTGRWPYKWRLQGNTATVDVWAHTDAKKGSALDIETVEAEVVYLIRQAGQWPAFQTEIHFHESQDFHRQVAAEIASRYSL